MLCVLLIGAVFSACLVDVGGAPETQPPEVNVNALIEEWLQKNLKDKLRDYLSDEEIKEIVGDLFREDIENAVNDAVLSIFQELENLLDEIDFGDFFTLQDLEAMLQQVNFEDILKDIDFGQLLDPEMLKGLFEDQIEDIVNGLVTDGLLDELMDSAEFKAIVKQIVRDTLIEILVGLG